MPDVKVPEFSEKKKCYHCGNVTELRRVGHYVQTTECIDEGDSGEWKRGVGYETLECPACNKVEFRMYRWDERVEEPELRYETLYPVPPKIPLGLPGVIEQQFIKCMRIKSIDPNAYGGAMRRLLALVCEERGAIGKDLYNKLENLAVKGEIPKQLLDVAHKLRGLGNVGEHPDIGELTDTEGPIIEGLSRAVLEYVYSAPYLLCQAEARLAQVCAKHNKPSSE
jgi:hypothetical protein